MKILRVILVLTFLLRIFPVNAQAKNLNQFISIVNPVRISSYTGDPGASFKAQYSEVSKRNLPATWLLTYDAISNENIATLAKSMNQSQERGLFLEVTPLFAKDAGVSYNKTDSWHRANSVFLTGYSQSDRLKLIDAVFEKFKKLFGFYPSSVGAWWIDSFSLEYMQQKYKITANLMCADQFATDGYQIWGLYWSTPYYPSKLHAGIPAGTLESKLDIVTLQWAARDPYNGYGRGSASLFSTQDYQKIDYFQKLIKLYTNKGSNKFGQITVGLEGDYIPQTYQSPGFFAGQLDVVEAEKRAGFVDVVTMRDFSNWYRSNFPDVSPAHLIQTDDFLGKNIKTIWYQSPKFRINITYNYDTKETKIRDFRTYHDNFPEPYYTSPDKDLNLSINLPSQIDSVASSDQEWMIFKDQLEGIEDSNEEKILNYKKHRIKLTKERFEFEGQIKSIPDQLSKSALINIKKSPDKVNFKIKDKWNFSKEGLIFKALTPEGIYFLKQRKVIVSEILIFSVFIITVFFIFKSKHSIFIKIVTIGMLSLLVVAASSKWYQSNSRLYFVNPAELDALNRLKVLPGRKIVVYDKFCLQCSWHTSFMPAIFANQRDYVGRISGKDIVYNFSVFDAKTREEGRKELIKLKADYIYAVRFEDYVEQVPFSPGDLNLEEVYSNANAQIWQIKKKTQ